jgi:hypothetical protein
MCSLRFRTSATPEIGFQTIRFFSTSKKADEGMHRQRLLLRPSLTEGGQTVVPPEAKVVASAKGPKEASDSRDAGRPQVTERQDRLSLGRQAEPA